MYAEIQEHPPVPNQSRYIRPIERKGGELGWRVFLEFNELYDYSRFLGWWRENIHSGDIYNYTGRFENAFPSSELFFAGLIRDKDEAEKFEVDWAILSKLCEENSDDESL